MSKMTFNKIGLIVHGPEVIDSGGCFHILNLLKDYNLTVKMGGMMGKTAVLDSQLEKTIDIMESKRPSEQLDELLAKEFDLIILLNQGKTLETGIAFGGVVISNSKRFSNEIPVIQVERPMENDGFLIPWNDSGKEIIKKLREIIKLPIFEESLTIPQRFKTKSSKNYRKLIGVNPNEKIFLNNVIIGYSTSNDITLVEKDGKLIDVIGGTINQHGLEKLKEKIDLKTAMIKTAKYLRKMPPKSQRILKKGRKSNKIAIIFNAEKVFDYLLKNYDAIISIGDDTTVITADSAYRFNVPVIGIIDGDMDGLLNSINTDLTLNELGEAITLAPNSIIIKVKPGFDDKMGELIKNVVFKGNETCEFEQIGELKEKIMKLISGHIVSKYEKL